MGFNMRRLHFWLEPKTSQSTATRCHSVLRLHQNSASRRLATELSALLTPTLFPSWSLTSPREPPASACPRAACRRVSGSRPGRPSPPSEGRSLVSPPASSPGCRLNAALDPKPRAPRTPIPPPSLQGCQWASRRRPRPLSPQPGARAFSGPVPRGPVSASALHPGIGSPPTPNQAPRLLLPRGDLVPRPALSEKPARAVDPECPARCPNHPPACPAVFWARPLPHRHSLSVRSGLPPSFIRSLSCFCL